MVISSKNKSWVIQPATDEDRIRQQMIFLLSTFIHTAILNRDFGIEHPLDSVNLYEDTKLKNKILIQANEFVPEFKIDWIKIIREGDGNAEVQVGGEVVID